MSRRQLLASGSLAMASAAVPLRAEVDAPNAGAGSLTAVKLSGEGLSLTPAELAGVLQSLTARGVEPDYYSNGGVVTEMETAFARELGKERAVFFPTGTLANHVAVRVLAGGDTRVLLQERSHVYNGSGDCVQVLSHLALVPLGTGQATFTAPEVERELERAGMGRVRTGVGVISIEGPVRLKLGERDKASHAEQQSLWGGLPPADSAEKTRRWAELAFWFPATAAPAGVQPVTAERLRNSDFGEMGGPDGTTSHSYMSDRRLHEVWGAYREIKRLFEE